MKTLSIILGLIVNSSASFAATVGDISFPDSETVDGKVLKLSGHAAMRTATFLAVKVYAGAFYLEIPVTPAKLSDQELDARGLDIIKSTQIKRIRMTFVRDIGEAKIVDTWKENFKKNCGTVCEKTRPKFEQVLACIKGDVKKGLTQTFTFFQDKVMVENTPPGASTRFCTINDPDYPNILLGAWIGNSEVKELKEAWLGKL